MINFKYNVNLQGISSEIKVKKRQELLLLFLATAH